MEQIRLKQLVKEFFYIYFNIDCFDIAIKRGSRNIFSLFKSTAEYENTIQLKQLEEQYEEENESMNDQDEYQVEDQNEASADQGVHNELIIPPIKEINIPCPERSTTAFTWPTI